MRQQALSLALLSLVAGLLAHPTLAQSTGQGCVSGRVVDSMSGQPLAAQLTFVGDDSTVRSVTGEFRLCDVFAGNYRVLAVADDYLRQYSGGIDTCKGFDCDANAHYLQASIVTVGTGSEPRVDFALKKGGSVAGTIFSDTGLPLAGAGVTVFRRNSFGGHSEIFTVTSDAQGRYEVPHELWGGDQYRLLVQHESHYGALNGVPECDPCHISLPGPTIAIPRAVRTQSDFVLRSRFSTISGTVTDRFTGMPIPNAQVSIMRPDGYSSVETDSSGFYSLTVAKGTFRIFAEAVGYARQVYPCSDYCELGSVAPITNSGAPMRFDFTLSSMAIWRLTPAWSSPRGGEYARLEGMNLDDVVELQIGGQPIPFRAANDSFVGFIIPPHPEGTVDLTVRDASGRSYTLPNALTYWADSVPSRIRDIEWLNGAKQDVPDTLAILNGVLYYSRVGGSLRDTSDLWRSDATEAGTYGVKGFGETVHAIEPLGSEIVMLVGSRWDVWRSDGTEPATRRVTTSSGSPLSLAFSLTNTDHGLLFAAEADGRRSWWILESPGAPPRKLRDAAAQSHLGEAVRIGSATFFIASEDGAYELWMTDGTVAGTRLVRRLLDRVIAIEDMPGWLTSFNGKLYFLMRRGELWESDGTEIGTRSVGRPAAGFTHKYLIGYGGSLYFEVFSASGTEIWKSDGTVAGTQRFSDGWGPLVEIGGRLYFMRTGGLTRTDGISIELVRSLERGENLSIAGETLWFSERPPEPCEVGFWCSPLWSSNGTPDGTFRYANVYWRDEPFEIRNEVCASALDETFDAGLFCAGADRTKIRRVFDFTPNHVPAGSDPRFRTPASGRLYIDATTSLGGHQLWVSNLTEAGTQPLALRAPAGFPGFNGGAIVSAGDTDYFVGWGGGEGTELWMTRGTPESTRLALDFLPGVESGAESVLFSSNEAIYFTGRASIDQPVGIWRFVPGQSPTQVLERLPWPMVRWNDEIVFAGDPSVDGCVVCAVDITTLQRRDLWNPAEQHPTEPQFEHIDVINGQVYVRTTTWPWTGLFRLNGASMRLSSERIEEIRAAGSSVITFDVRQPSIGSPFLEVVSFDESGSPSLVGTIDSLSEAPFGYWTAGETIFFSIRRGQNIEDFELWSLSDRRLTMVREWPVADAVGTPEGVLFFHSGSGSDKGIWRSDGTREGTSLAWKIAADDVAHAGRFTLHGAWLVFAADFPAGDTEPWRVRYKTEPKPKPLRSR